MDATTWQRPCRRRAATPAHPSRNLTPQHNAKPNPAPACGLAGAQLRQKAGCQNSLSALPQDDQRPSRRRCHVNALRRMNLKNAKEAAERQRREEAAERQRREEEVPANVAAVNTAGHHASVTSAAASGQPSGTGPGDSAAKSGQPSGTGPGVTQGETFVHGELCVALTTSGGQRVFVPYAIVSGALAPLGQHCAPAAGRTCPCGAPLSRWCPHCKQERTEFFAQSTKEGDSTKEEDSSDSSAEEASAAGTDAEEDGDTETATLPEPLKDDVPPQGASATPPGPREDGLPSQGASAGGGDSVDGVAVPPSVSGHGGRELPPAGKKKKKKKKTPPQGEGVPAPPVPAASSAGPDEGEPDESVGAATGSDEREAAEVPPPYTFLICGYDTNGSGVVCLAPRCGGVAKGALQCRTCDLPSPERRRVSRDPLLNAGWRLRVTSGLGHPYGCGASGAVQGAPSRRPPNLYDWVAPTCHWRGRRMGRALAQRPPCLG